MSDDEMEREWSAGKGSNRQRPQSTMARSFSASLNELFKIDNSLADLDFAIEQKKKAVSSQTSELEALEARLRATEERLKQRQAMTGSGSQSPRQRTALGDTFSPAQQQQPQPARPAPTSPLSSNELSFRPKTPTRPGTAKRDVAAASYGAPPMPGALPPTPGASEGEYEGEEPPPLLLKTCRSGGSSADYVFVDKDGDSQSPPGL